MGTRPSGLVWPTWNPYVCLSIAHRAQASCWGGHGPGGEPPLWPERAHAATAQSRAGSNTPEPNPCSGGANPVGHAPIGDDLGEKSLPSGRSRLCSTMRNKVNHTGQTTSATGPHSFPHRSETDSAWSKTLHTTCTQWGGAGQGKIQCETIGPRGALGAREHERARACAR